MQFNTFCIAICKGFNPVCRVWQNSTRSHTCKAVFRPLSLMYFLKTRACTCHTLQTGFQLPCIFNPTFWCNGWLLHNFAGIIFHFFTFFLCKFQVISQAEQEQAELEVKTTKHEIFKVNSLSLHIQLNNTVLKPITELGNEHCD